MEEERVDFEDDRLGQDLTVGQYHLSGLYGKCSYQDFNSGRFVLYKKRAINQTRATDR